MMLVGARKTEVILRGKYERTYRPMSMVSGQERNCRAVVMVGDCSCLQVGPEDCLGFASRVECAVEPPRVEDDHILWVSWI